MQVIFQLWLRQLKRYYRNRSRIVGSLGQPILFLVALGYGFGPIFQQAGHGNYIQFIAPGIICMSILFTSVFSGTEIIWDKQFGFLKETLVAPVSRVSIMVGRTLGGATVAFLQGCIVLLLTLLLGFHIHNVALLPVAFLIMFLIALVFTSLGAVIGAVLNDMQGFQLIVNFLVMPMFFLSGALFPLQGLHGVINTLVRIDPLTYGVDGMRHLLLNAGRFNLVLDSMILLLIAVCLLSLGSYFFRKTQV